MASPRNASQCALLFQTCKSIGPDGKDIFNKTCIEIILRKYSCGRRPRPTTSDALSPSTFVQSDPNITLWLVILLLTIAILSLLANAFVCVVYALFKEIRAAKHYFIVNLAVADMLIATLAIPFFLASYFYNARVTLCQIGSVFDVLCCTLSIINFATISFERFIAIKYPLRYPSIVSSRRCLWAVAFVWFYAILTAVSSLNPTGGLHLRHCVFFSDVYIVSITFTSFLLPLLVMLVTYGWIFKIAKYQVRQIHNSTPSGSGMSVRNEFKAAKTLTLIIGIYVLCWCPFFLYICIVVVFKVTSTSVALIYSVHVIRYLNSLANPFIYVGINRDFRRKCFKLLRAWTSLRGDETFNRSGISTSTTNVSMRTTTLNSVCDDLDDTSGKK